MRTIAMSRTRLEATVHPTYLLPTFLGMNMLILYVIEVTQGIPPFIKLAANLLLAF